MSWQQFLLVIGGLLQFAGVLFIGFPDLLPHAVRLSSWLRRRARWVSNRIRRLFRMDPRPTTVEVGIALEGSAALSASAEVHAAKDLTIAEKVEFLIRRDQNAQRDLNRIAKRVETTENETSRRLDQLGDDLKAHVERKLTVAAEAYRPLRIAGTLALALGLVAVSIAPFA